MRKQQKTERKKMDKKKLTIVLNNILESWEMQNVKNIANANEIVIEFKQNDIDYVLIIKEKKRKKNEKRK